MLITSPLLKLRLMGGRGEVYVRKTLLHGVFLPLQTKFTNLLLSCFYLNICSFLLRVLRNFPSELRHWPYRSAWLWRRRIHTKSSTRGHAKGPGSLRNNKFEKFQSGLINSLTVHWLTNLRHGLIVLILSKKCNFIVQVWGHCIGGKSLSMSWEAIFQS